MQASRTPSSNTFLTLAALAALGLAAAPAHAGGTTLNFDNFTASSATFGGGAQFIGPSYSTQGFTLVSGDPNGFFALNGSEENGDGETSLYSLSGGSTTLTQDSGKAFNFSAIDLGPLGGNDTAVGTLYDGPVAFTGRRADGSTVTRTVTITGTQYQTFTFTGFTDLQSLTFVGNLKSGGTSAPQFDNVVLSPVPEASSTVSLGLMLALGLGGVIARRRKKTAAGL